MRYIDLRRSILVIFALLATMSLKAQMVIDRVAAVVGDEAVMQSDIESQILQLKEQKVTDVKNPECWIMGQIMEKKLLLSRARTDSLKVSDEQVDNELERRMQFFIQQFRGVDNLEAFYKKSVAEIKNEFRESVKEQMLMEQMQGKIVGGVEISPEEVRKFFRNTPSDSLPYYNTEVEIGQIVIYPRISKEERDRVKLQLEDIRTRIINGASFRVMATTYSEDLGTALRNGGEMEMQKASNFVPEFAAAALSLKKDSISGVVETKFGYHIIQLLERKGDMVHVRHILLKPKLSTTAKLYAAERLDSIRNQVLNIDTLTFEKLAYLYDEDNDTKNRGGMLIDMKTNALRIPVDELDATTFFTIDKLEVGGISEPVPYSNQMEGKEGYRILFLKSKTQPHKASLEEDYPKLKQIAVEQKKVDVMDQWFAKNIERTYVRLAPEYTQCEELDKWKHGLGMQMGRK